MDALREVLSLTNIIFGTAKEEMELIFHHQSKIIEMESILSLNLVLDRLTKFLLAKY